MKNRSTFAALAPCLLAATCSAAAVAADGRWSGSLQGWGYAAYDAVADSSVLDPDDRIAAIDRDTVTADLRCDVKYAADAVDVVARPRLLIEDERGGVAGSTGWHAYASQAYLRWRPSADIAATVGRDAFDWGPANFRSPSNPFYFDGGRTDPLRDVSGIDLARVTAIDGADILTAAYVVGSGHDLADNPYRDTAVLKLDRRGENGLASLIVASQRHASTFIGAFGQVTIGEPWLLYAEAGSQRLRNELEVDAPADPTPYRLQPLSPRAATGLAGVTYTLENGQTIGAEYLRDNHGFRGPVEREYFDRAAGLDAAAASPPASPPASAALGLAIAYAPRLLGRDYLYLLWQGNPNVAGAFWRLSWTANLDDRSGQVAAYGEVNLAERVTAFVQVAIDHGARRGEFRSLLDGSITVGAKVFAF